MTVLAEHAGLDHFREVDVIAADRHEERVDLIVSRKLRDPIDLRLQRLVLVRQSMPS